MQCQVYMLKVPFAYMYVKSHIFKFSYVVGTHKNRLNETVLLSTQKHILKIMGKKIFAILR